MLITFERPVASCPYRMAVACTDSESPKVIVICNESLTNGEYNRLVFFRITAFGIPVNGIPNDARILHSII